MIKMVEQSLKDEMFVKFVLSKPTSPMDVKKVTTRIVQIKDEDMLSIVSSHETKDVTKNHSKADGLAIMRKLLDTEFENATLLTLEGNYQLEKTKSGLDKIHESAPTSRSIPSKTHNHSKMRLVAKDRPFLKTIGLVNSSGEIKSKMDGKYYQVESFINILSNTIKQSALKDATEITVYDMGAGSGYVTFAIYDYVVQTLKKDINLVGADINNQLVERNNLYARELDFQRLSFVESSIGDLESIDANIVVALHACNTATDDAIFAGIRSNSEIIIVSPCCHQELRNKMKTPQVLESMHKFGTHKEHEAVMLTDTIRTLILEINGYKTNLFEFVSDEHSGKNNIIVAIKKQSNQDRNKFSSQLSELKAFYRITESLYLESLFEA